MSRYANIPVKIDDHVVGVARVSEDGSISMHLKPTQGGRALLLMAELDLLEGVRLSSIHNPAIPGT